MRDAVAEPKMIKDYTYWSLISVAVPMKKSISYCHQMWNMIWPGAIFLSLLVLLLAIIVGIYFHLLS